MVAPAVASEMLIVCCDVYVPLTGLNVGEAATGTVYVADARVLLAKFGARAIARMVPEELSVIGPAYCVGEEEKG